MAAALCLPLNIQAATPVRQARKAAAPQKDICLQLYSVRDLLKDVNKDGKASAEWTGLLSRLHKMGYTSTEAANYDQGRGTFYNRTPKQYRQDIEAAGMKVLSSHVAHNLSDQELASGDYSEALKWWKKCIADHKAAGMSYIVNPWIGKQKSLHDLDVYCKYLNDVGKMCKEAGLGFGYHNHNYEFEKVEGKVRGHEGWRVCFKADTPEEEGWSIIADRVRTVLVSSGDAVSIEDILAQMPHLDREVILRVCQENIKDAVTFSMDEIQYAKLLETYYLPDDFGETLSAFVNKTESSQGVASIVLFEAEFEAKYGEGFRVNFGLEDDAVFKQVIAKSFAGDAHEWKKDTFISEHRRAESNVAEVFLQTHDGLFHEEDFFKFALESRGMKNRGMLILTFLRKHCVRLSKAWWISLSGFDRKVAITEEQYLQIGMVLNRCVGNNAFVPIAALSNEVYESLPRLELEGRVLEWNAYLLTSLSVLRVKNARVINDEPSPYTVTGLIVPYDVGEIRDVVEYALHCYPTGYFSDADAAFDYLKANNIRMTKTEKLVAKINEMLKVV